MTYVSLSHRDAAPRARSGPDVLRAFDAGGVAANVVRGVSTWHGSAVTYQLQWLLHRLDRGGVPEQLRPQIRDLIVLALKRPYRRKDWTYARLVRHVLDTSFSNQIEALLGAEDPFIRLRAQFMHHVARHPQ